MKILFEMAIPLKDAKKKAVSLGSPFERHWAYIFILGSSNDSYEHWVKEIANFSKQIDNIKIKGGGRLDPDFLIDSFMFHIDTDKDAEIIVNANWADHDEDDNLPSIIDLDLTRYDFNQFKEFRNECFNELSKLFCDKEDHTKEFFQEYIKDKINKYNR